MKTVQRLIGASVVFGLAVAACTNDYEAFDFSGTGGATGTGGGSGKGGTSAGGAGGSVSGGGGTAAGGTGGTAAGGTGGTAAGGTGGTAAGGTGGTAAGGTAAGGTGGTAAGGTGGTAAGGTGGTTGCTGNNKSCNGVCVGTNDPKFGCGPTACDPCQIANATSQCVQGKCALQTCSTGFDSCDNNAANGCEQKLDTTEHCGACGRKCGTQSSTAAVCAASACTHTCQAGFGDCSHPTTGPDNGCETNLNTTKNSCGTCGNNCGSLGANGGLTCKAGSCGCAEDAQCLTAGGLANSSCDKPSGLCVCDGATCKSGEECGKVNGNTVCRCDGGNACGTGETCCPGDGCADLQTDEKNCGGCNIACATGKTCTAGSCQ